ncbi:MAG: hypothetical protein PHR16_04130 [Methylovulum sp.]|nr:hypothetical protein [Methylovulum sp.]
MKPIEIVELIKQETPKVLGKTPDERTAKIIFAALRQISKQLDQTTEGNVKIPGLGVFNIRQVEREKEGQSVSTKKISFRAAKLKAKEGKATEN